MNAIFAVNASNGFAVNDTMPWPRSTVDLQRFKSLTSGQTVIMGRGTWDSDMPKPLPNRRNCVLSTTLVDSRCEVFSSVESLLSAVDTQHCWVIGGEKILWSLRPYITTVYLTQFMSDHAADVVLDVARYLDQYTLVETEQFQDHTFKIYTNGSYEELSRIITGYTG